jgi:hypothetical protein
MRYKNNIEAAKGSTSPRTTAPKAITIPESAAIDQSYGDTLEDSGDAKRRLSAKRIIAKDTGTEKTLSRKYASLIWNRKEPNMATVIKPRILRLSMKLDNTIEISENWNRSIIASFVDGSLAVPVFQA